MAILRLKHYTIILQSPRRDENSGPNSFDPINGYSIDGKPLWQGLGQKLGPFVRDLPHSQPGGYPDFTERGEDFTRNTPSPKPFKINDPNRFTIELNLNGLPNMTDAQFRQELKGKKFPPGTFSSGEDGGNNERTDFIKIRKFIKETINTATSTNPNYPTPPIVEYYLEGSSIYQPPDSGMPPAKGKDTISYYGSDTFIIEFKAPDKVDSPLDKSFFTFNIDISIEKGKFYLSDYEVDVTLTNLNTNQETTETVDLYEALEVRLQRYIKTTGAEAEGYGVRTLGTISDSDLTNIEIEVNLVRSKMELPSGSIDSLGKVTPGPSIIDFALSQDTDYVKAIAILGEIENIVKDVLNKAKPKADFDSSRINLKPELPVPLKFTFQSKNEPSVNTWFRGDGGWLIEVKVSNANPPGAEYIPDTTPFKKRGFVKIQGEEKYRTVGQVLGKDFVNNPTSIASDNQTHLNGQDSDEQAENSVAVAVWQFKNIGSGTPTFDEVSNFHYGSNLKSKIYGDEKFRIHSILDPSSATK